MAHLEYHCIDCKDTSKGLAFRDVCPVCGSKWVENIPVFDDVNDPGGITSHDDENARDIFYPA
jgi:hypothetical protein